MSLFSIGPMDHQRYDTVNIQIKHKIMSIKVFIHPECHSGSVVALEINVSHTEVKFGEENVIIIYVRFKLR